MRYLIEISHECIRGPSGRGLRYRLAAGHAYSSPFRRLNVLAALDRVSCRRIKGVNTKRPSRQRNMSAYGAIKRAVSGTLPSTTWLTGSKRPDAPKHLTLHHLTLDTAQKHAGLIEYLHRVFADELEGGQTYPQEILAGEEYTAGQFAAYYFAADVIVAVVGLPAQEGIDLDDGKEIQLGFAEAAAGRTWEDCIAGCYYVSLPSALRKASPNV